MAPDRRLKVLLTTLGAVVVLALVYWWWPEPAASAPVASKNRGGQRAASNQGSTSAPDVHLEALDAARPKPGGAERNLFRFKPKAPPPPPPAPPRPIMTVPDPVPTDPPPPPPPPPIALKFIGIVEAPEQAKKIAVLSDSRGVYHGREGDIIEGRYRILRIGAESIELAYLDGSGRQTIRLSGS